MSVSIAHPPLPRVLRRRLKANRIWRRWTAAWVGGSVLGIANGVIRELVYKDRVGELRANQIAVAILIALLALYFSILERRWPISTLRAAIAIGATWAVLTVVFEFVFGHWVDGKTWSELFENYDIADGRLWLAALIWIGAGPAVIRRLRRSDRRDTMKRIVIATDGSDGAGQALEQGFSLASDLGAEVSVVYVHAGARSFLGAPYYQDVITEEARQARTVIDDAKVRASRYGADVEYEVLEGDPVDTVLALARSREADLIVVGSRGLGTVSSVVLGSVSKAILHQADGPVLVARTPTHVATA